MAQRLPSFFMLAVEVSRALQSGTPVVALESAVITHGLPRPENLELARRVQVEVSAQGAVPATIAVLRGKLRVGLEDAELEELANAAPVRKISLRDFGAAVADLATGGTTVAGSLAAARLAGIRVFATGGIGGVHRGAAWDVSADLTALAHIPIVVVCSGAKAILDLPATLEYLETAGVPVIGYQTAEFPAFYSRESGLHVDASVRTPAEAARIARAHWDMGLSSAVVVTVPPPEEAALPRERVEGWVQQAVEEAHKNGIVGPAVTPFLLRRVSELSGGESLVANLALLANDARVAAQIAAELAPRKRFASM